MKLRLLKFTASFSFIFLCVFAADAQSGNNKNRSQNIAPTADKPLEITEKQPPRVDVFGYCFRQYGLGYVKVSVRITFDKSGTVTAAEIVKASECREFDEESVSVARRIKFNPAIKDGEPITVTKVAVYEGGVR